MKLACIGPLSPLKTGVAHFSENLLPFLAHHCDIKLFTDAYPPSATPILKKFPVARVSDFLCESSGFDIVLYHMGNHYAYHKSVFEALYRVPGVVLLHDCVLHHFFSRWVVERGNLGAFRALLKLYYPDLSNDEISAFFEEKGDPYQLPISGIVARLARGTIVMTDYGRDIVLEEAPGAKVRKINHPYFPPDTVGESTRMLRKRFDVPETDFVVSSVGHLTPAKRIDVALEAFSKFHERFPNSVFLLAGESSLQLPLADMISRIAPKGAKYLGYLDDSDFDSLMRLTDVFINLRYPSNGEMSGSLLHMLGRGKVTIVSNYAQFKEFPDDVCVKINFGSSEADDLAQELLSLAHNSARRSIIGEAARKHIRQNHTREAAAQAIVDFAKDVATAKPMLSPTEIDNLLLSDGLARRSYQWFLYNTRRLSSLYHEHGLVPTVRQAVRRIFGGKL